MDLTVVTFDDAPAYLAAVIAAATDAFASAGAVVDTISVPHVGLPKGTAEEQIATMRSFTLTPGALIESWRVARHLDVLTEQGRTVVIPDYEGRGGVFALEQAMSASEGRRTVWTLAGCSTLLGSLDRYGTTAGTDDDAESRIDWEVTQYRWSDRVVGVADRAAHLLTECGVHVTTLPLGQIAAGAGDRPSDGVIWVPEPVCRRTHAIDTIRAVVEHLRTHPDAEAVVSAEDEDDVVWRGSTWSNITVPAVLAARVARSDEPPVQPDAVILGDPFAVPIDAVVGAHAAGTTVIVPDGSVAAAFLEGAPSWSTVDGLVDLLDGGTAVPVPQADAAALSTAPSPRRERPERAVRVSVGIPVFRDIRYLEECVNSVLDQTQAVHEILLYDDGSASDEVTSALEALAADHEQVIRVMEGPNRGVCVARNAMIEAFSGDAFLLIDSDDVLHPEAVESCANALRARPSLGAVATWTEFFGAYEGIEAKPPYDARVGMRENPIISTGVLVDVGAWRAAGAAFAEDLAYLYCEDWHVWSQLVAAGVAIGLVPRPLIRHRVHDTSGATRRTGAASRLGKARATEPLRRARST